MVDRTKMTVTYEDGFSYSAEAGRAKLKRLKRIFERLRHGAGLSGALLGMTIHERRWLIKFSHARAAFQKLDNEKRKAEAVAKVEAWKKAHAVPEGELP